MRINTDKIKSSKFGIKPFLFSDSSKTRDNPDGPPLGGGEARPGEAGGEGGW